MLFSEHPLESCLNDPLTLECEVGLFLLDLRVGGLVPALPRGRAWTTQYLYCPTGLQGTSGSTSGTSFATNQGFRSLLHAAALGVLSNFNPAALQAVLLHLNLETLLCWKVTMLGEGRCPSLLSFSK